MSTWEWLKAHDKVGIGCMGFFVFYGALSVFTGEFDNAVAAGTLIVLLLVGMYSQKELFLSRQKVQELTDELTLYKLREGLDKD